jgi:hypothetical protein
MDKEIMVYVPMEYYSAIRKKGIMSFFRMELEIMLSRINQTQKDKCHMFSLISRI